MNISEYDQYSLAKKILYLATLFNGIKDHLKVLNEKEELSCIDSQLFTILNDLEFGTNELCNIYEKLENSNTQK